MVSVKQHRVAVLWRGDRESTSRDLPEQPVSPRFRRAGSYWDSCRACGLCR
jgi:hypothetical protein